MTEPERIVDQYERVLSGAAWHGDPVWKLLEGVSPECAAYRGASNTHNIWELVMHMSYWEDIAYRRLSNQEVTHSEARNFPAMPEVSAANWSNMLESLRKSNENFRSALRQLDPARLDQKMARDHRKSYYVEAHGLIQHHVYHAGQIALLKRAFEERASRGEDSSMTHGNSSHVSGD